MPPKEKTYGAVQLMDHCVLRGHMRKMKILLTTTITKRETISAPLGQTACACSKPAPAIRARSNACGRRSGRSCVVHTLPSIPPSESSSSSFFPFLIYFPHAVLPPSCFCCFSFFFSGFPIKCIRTISSQLFHYQHHSPATTNPRTTPAFSFFCCSRINCG